MIESLTIFTSLTTSYRYSAELQLSLNTLKSTFPNANWIMHTPESALPLTTLIRKNLPDDGYILFIKEPAMFVGQSMLSLLKQYLDTNPDISVTLPNDPANAGRILTPTYHTLRGFEQFCDELAQCETAAHDYDGRDCWIFLTTSHALSQCDLPNDPFQLLKQLSAKEIAVIPQAYVHPFYNYYNETRADMLPYIPKGIQSLLDIGCSRGGFAKTVKNTLNCRVAGIEMNRHEAEIAKQKLDILWIGDVLSLDVPEKFDCISCLDVLEHLPEPEALLHRIKQWLNPGGSILLNVPNVGFWAVVEDLLAGRWDYVPAGILCNTHLRFYTLHSLQKLLNNCGLTPIRIERQCIPIPERLQSGLSHYQSENLDVDYENLSTNAFTILAQCTS